MDLLVSNLGIPSGLVGWKMLQTKTPADFTAFTSDPVLKRTIAYFQANAPKAASAKDLLKDPQLEDVALTAFGLTAQVGMQALMTQVLASNVTDTKSVASKMTDPRYRAIAAAFNFGGTTTPAQAAVASSANVGLTNLDGNSFDSFGGTFGGVTVKNVGLTGAGTSQQIAAALQSAFQRADGNRTDITVKAVGFKLVLSDARGRGTAQGFAFDSGNSPVAVAGATMVSLSGLTTAVPFKSFSATFAGVTATGVDLSKAATPTAIAAAVQAGLRKADGGASNIGVTVAANGTDLVLTDALARSTAHSVDFVPTVATTKTVTGASASVPTTLLTLQNFGTGGSLDSFSGHFAGVTVQGVDLSAATTAAQVATTLTSAFQQADGYNTSITVTAKDNTLTFDDSTGGGTNDYFDFAAAGANGATASAPTKMVAGSQASATQGGPAVTSSSFIDQVVKLYTQAKFQETVGNTDSNALREAMYAKQQLPKITNWYSVISDRPLANVVQTVLNLPDSFVSLNVDKQVATLTAKMNIKDFTDPTKLGALLNRFVAMSMANGSDTPAASSAATLSPATMLLGNIPGGTYSGSGSGAGALSMLSAITGIDTSGSNSSTFSGASLAALLLSTSQGS